MCRRIAISVRIKRHVECIRTVIARRDRAIQYSRALAIDPSGRDVVDHPLEPVIGLAEWRDPVADDDSRHD
jgi:hypothetical protein